MKVSLDDLRDRYLQAQLAGDRRKAVQLVVEDGLLRGVTIGDLQHHVIQAAQHQIGVLWQRNEVTIAQEHMATAISQLTLAALYERASVSARNGKKVVIACVEGELHDLPARLVADYLDLAGFDVRYLGADVPHDHLVAMVVTEQPDLIGLSVTMSFNVGAAKTAVQRLRAATTAPLFIGGHATTWSTNLVTELGVASSGNSPAELVAVARQLAGLPEAP